MDNEMTDEMGRKMIIERFTHPQYYQEKWSANQQSKVHPLYSPTCADRLEVIYEIKNNQLVNLRFSGSACAIATASTDLLIEKITGLDLPQVKEILINYEKLIREGKVNPEQTILLGNLMAFKNVYRQKNRHVCATLLSKFLLDNFDNLNNLQ